MKRIELAALALLLSAVCSSAAPQIIAFARDSNIWVADLDGTHPRKITKGSGPDISPDGSHIAFNTEEKQRRIAVVEVATKKVRVFHDEIPSDNCFGAIWSPDGHQILFNIWTDDKWHLGSIQADGSGFRYVRKSSGSSDSLWSTCYAPDGNSIYGQDLDRIYQFSLDGKEQARWEIKSLFPNGGCNSNSHFAVSPDGKRLLMEVDMDDEEVSQPGWEGPPPALWLLEFGSRKVTRLTPKGLLAWDGSWLDDARILYASQTAKEKQPVLSEMTLAERNRKSILKNVTTPTVSRP